MPTSRKKIDPNDPRANVNIGSTIGLLIGFIPGAIIGAICGLPGGPVGIILGAVMGGCISGVCGVVAGASIGWYIDCKYNKEIDDKCEDDVQTICNFEMSIPVQCKKCLTRLSDSFFGLFAKRQGRVQLDQGIEMDEVDEEHPKSDSQRP